MSCRTAHILCFLLWDLKKERKERRKNENTKNRKKARKNKNEDENKDRKCRELKTKYLICIHDNGITNPKFYTVNTQ